MPSHRLRLRAAALLGGGALMLHQLRYLLAYGGETSRRLEIEGHSYLGLVAPVLAVLLLLALVEFLVRLSRARATSSAEPKLPSAKRLWALTSAALALIYTAQESVESELAAGHPHGAAAIVGHRGWIAALLAITIGGVVALLLRGASAAIELVVQKAARRPRPSRTSGKLRPRDWRAPRLDVLGAHLAGRAPPIPSI